MGFFKAIYEAWHSAPVGTYSQDSGLWDASNDSLMHVEPTVVNPATSLPMIDGFGSVDVAGSPFGIDIHAPIDTSFDTFSNSVDTSFTTFSDPIDTSSCGFSDPFSSSMFD